MPRRYNRRGPPEEKERERVYRVVTALAEARPVLRASDIREASVSPRWLESLQRFELEPAGPGIYVQRGHVADVLELVQHKYPKAVLGMLSALWMIGILDERPELDTWLISRNAWMPTWDAKRTVFYRSRHHEKDVWNLAHNKMPLRVHAPVHAAIDCVRFRDAVPDIDADAVLRRCLDLQVFTVPLLLEKAKDLRQLTPVKEALSRLERERPLWLDIGTAAARAELHGESFPLFEEVEEEPS